jgi:hypothetical protein
VVDFIINVEANLITARAGLHRGYSNQAYGAYGNDGNGELAPSQLRLVVRSVGGVGRQDGLLRRHSLSLPLTGWKAERQVAGLAPTIRLKVLVK